VANLDFSKKVVQDVEKLLDSSEASLSTKLGIALFRYRTSGLIVAKANYSRLGKDFATAVAQDLQTQLCESGRPKPWVEELIGGDIRELIVALLSVLVATLDVPLALAVPAVALLLKRGIRSLCLEISPASSLGAVKKMLQVKGSECEIPKHKGKRRGK